MVKQKLEGIFTKSVKARKDLWYIKLQVHPMAHTKSPGDFLVLGKEKRHLVECKQIDMRRNEKNTWPFKRLTQEEDMIKFDDMFKTNTAYLLILFLRKRVADSDFYLVPITQYKKRLKDWHKKSMQMIEFHEMFFDYKINSGKGGILDLRRIK